MGKHGTLHKADHTGEPFYDFYKGWRGKTPVNAIRLAIADHQAAPYSSGMGNTDYVQQLQIAQKQCEAFSDLLQALEAIMADYEAWQKGDIENPMAIVNEEKAIAAIKQAKGE